MLRKSVMPILGAAVVMLYSSPAWVADHEDGSITQDRPADISDFHAFVNPNNGNVVLSMAVNGFSVPGFANSFSPETLLQIKIDNTGDFVEDLVIQAVFEGPSNDQTVTVIGPAAPEKVGAETKILKYGGSSADAAPAISGPVGEILDDVGIRAFAGPTDDATWVDLIFIEAALTGASLGRDPGIDTVQGLNAATLAVELHPDDLRGPTGNIIRVWATTSRQHKTTRSSKRDDKNSGPWIQVDSDGIPALNPVAIPPSLRNAFNRSTPSEHVELFQDVIIATVLTLNGGNQMHASFVAGLLLPDVLTLDMTSLADFPNGRRPESDFADVALGLLSNGALTSDGVAGNDVMFLADFPFFPPPHTPDEVIPSRN